MLTQDRVTTFQNKQVREMAEHDKQQEGVVDELVDRVCTRIAREREAAKKEERRARARAQRAEKRKLAASSSSSSSSSAAPGEKAQSAKKRWQQQQRKQQQQRRDQQAQLEAQQREQQRRSKASDNLKKLKAVCKRDTGTLTAAWRRILLHFQDPDVLVRQGAMALSNTLFMRSAHFRRLVIPHLQTLFHQTVLPFHPTAA